MWRLLKAIVVRRQNPMAKADRIVVRLESEMRPKPYASALGLGDAALCGCPCPAIPAVLRVVRLPDLDRVVGPLRVPDAKVMSKSAESAPVAEPLEVARAGNKKRNR
jgi:hypothetical protein